LRSHKASKIWDAGTGSGQAARSLTEYFDHVHATDISDADETFWAEVCRVAKPQALFAAWTYQLPSSETAAQAEFLDPVLNLIDPYWAEGNRLCMAGYTAEAVNCPYPTRPVPKLDAGGSWTGQRLVNFVESWSAHYRARQDGLDKSLIELSQNFLDKYADKKLTISLPISLLAATISK